MESFGFIVIRSLRSKKMGQDIGHGNILPEPAAFVQVIKQPPQRNKGKQPGPRLSGLFALDQAGGLKTLTTNKPVQFIDDIEKAIGLYN